MTGCNLGPAARESSMRCSSSARRLWLVLLPTKQTKLHDEKRLMTDKGTVVSLFLFSGALSRRPGRSCRAALRLPFRLLFRTSARSFPAGSLLSVSGSTIASSSRHGLHLRLCTPKVRARGRTPLRKRHARPQRTSQVASRASTPQGSSHERRARSRNARACEAAAALPRAPKSTLRGGGPRAVFDGARSISADFRRGLGARAELHGP